LKGYEKHRKAMSVEPVPVPSWFGKSEEEFVRSFGRKVKKRLDFYKTSVPNGSATFDLSKKEGGKLVNIKKDQHNKFMRTEPIWYSVHGYPGSGKSLHVNTLAKKLCAALSYSWPQDVFFRNCATKHWDGYRGQPIVILDDVGAGGKESTDFTDLVGIVSTSTYPLPMADLSDKGVVFTSPFILSATNYPKHNIQFHDQWRTRLVCRDCSPPLPNRRILR